MKNHATETIDPTCRDNDTPLPLNHVKDNTGVILTTLDVSHTDIPKVPLQNTETCIACIP